MLECFLDDPTLRQAEHPHFHSEGLAGVRRRSQGSVSRSSDSLVNWWTFEASSAQVLRIAMP